MNQKTAQRIFIFFNIVAVILIAYVVDDFISIFSSVDAKKDKINFDSGIYYFFLITIFWVFSLIQYVGLRNGESSIVKYANQITVVWFIFTLILANLLPLYVTGKLEEAGYNKCTDTREISRVAKGESSIYSLEKCRNVGQS